MQAARSCRNVCWVAPDFAQCVGSSVAAHPLSTIALATIFRNDRTKPSRAINTMIATEAWRRQAPQTGAQSSMLIARDSSPSGGSIDEKLPIRPSRGGNSLATLWSYECAPTDECSVGGVLVRATSPVQNRAYFLHEPMASQPWGAIV